MSDNNHTLNAMTWIDVLYAIMQWKRRIILTSIAVSSCVALYTLTLSKTYESSAVVLIPERGTGGLLESISGSAGLSALAGSLSGGSTSNQRYMAILNSRRLRESLIIKFDLREQYKDTDVVNILKNLEDDLKVEQTKQGTIIIRTRFAKDPQIAADIANYTVKKLDEINRELLTDQARATRKFIETRYGDAKEELRKVEDSLNFFQKKFGVISIADQTKASIEAAAEVEARTSVAESEYNILKYTLSASHPDVERMGMKVAELKKLQTQLEFGGKNHSIFIPFKSTADIGLEYVRLYRQVQIYGKIVEFLIPQVEQAKIQEARDTPTIIVLDNAGPAPHPYGPRKTLITLITAMLTMSLLSSVAVVRAYWQKNQITKTIENNDKLKFVFDSIKLKNILK